MTQENKDLLLRAGKRFLRVAGAALLSILIPAIIEVISNLQFDPAIKNIVSLVLLPLLASLDKFLRDSKIY